MKLMLRLLLFQLRIWIFHLSLVYALPFPLVSSPAASPVFPISTSMAAFSPGIHSQLGFEEEHRNMESGNKKVLLLIVASSTLAAIIVLSLFGFCFYYRKFSQRHKNDAEKGLSVTPFLGKFNSLRRSVSLIDYKTLEKGTNNFGDDNLLSNGGFGRLYKALLEGNLNVAVKKLDCASEDEQREFETEVDLLSKIRHPNIISLFGYSVREEMGFIVYELMENGSLEHQLHGPSHGFSLTWHIRLKIAVDIARGLEYLHEYCKPAVIHGDLKSSNVLLDSKFNAKLSDFGLAVADCSQNKNKLKLSGTVGYVAPEYMLDGELTDKSDVYAFGIVLLELLFRRRPVEKLAPAHCQSIVTWAMPQLTNRASLPHIVDPVIKDSVDEKYLFQVAAMAVLCVQPEPSYRPLITDVVHSLIPLVPFEFGGTLRATPH